MMQLHNEVHTKSCTRQPLEDIYNCSQRSHSDRDPEEVAEYHQHNYHSHALFLNENIDPSQSQALDVLDNESTDLYSVTCVSSCTLLSSASPIKFTCIPNTQTEAQNAKNNELDTAENQQHGEAERRATEQECDDHTDLDEEEEIKPEKHGKEMIENSTELRMVRTKSNRSLQSREKYSRAMINAMIGADTFVTDYLQEMLAEEQETNSLEWFKKDKISSETMKKRRDTIDWICGVGVSCGLQRSTIYRCIYYFDRLYSEKELDVCRLQMIAAVCLLIAVKWNEKEEKVPSLYQLSELCDKCDSPNQFKTIELRVLSLLSFRLKLVLPIDFVSYYIERGCVFADDRFDGDCNLQLNKKTNVHLLKYAIFFLDVITPNYSFWQYLPSVLAFSVIVASRRALEIEPYFNGKLVDLCKHHPSEISQCFDEMWNEYRSEYANDGQRAEKLQPHGLQHYYDNDEA